jgi:TPP-dependent pyruvate/acetoin dehydrogenase alpha subunit
VDDDAVASMDAEVHAAFEAAHEFALNSPFPEPGDVSKGVWVEDGYWQGEPGRDGGTEAG